MDLLVRREPTTPAGLTFGALWINGARECWTLEDAIRERPGLQVAAWKVPGESAIPAGRYRVVISKSQRFHRLMPEILNVPGFSGVRIHPGNAIADTEGCLLVGNTRVKSGIGESRAAFEAVYRRLVLAQDEPIILTIENPPEVAPSSGTRVA